MWPLWTGGDGSSMHTPDCIGFYPPCGEPIKEALRLETCGLLMPKIPNKGRSSSPTGTRRDHHAGRDDRVVVTLEQVAGTHVLEQVEDVGEVDVQPCEDPEHVREALHVLARNLLGMCAGLAPAVLLPLLVHVVLESVQARVRRFLADHTAFDDAHQVQRVVARQHVHECRQHAHEHAGPQRMQVAAKVERDGDFCRLASNLDTFVMATLTAMANVSPLLRSHDEMKMRALTTTLPSPTPKNPRPISASQYVLSCINYTDPDQEEASRTCPRGARAAVAGTCWAPLSSSISGASDDMPFCSERKRTATLHSVRKRKPRTLESKRRLHVRWARVALKKKAAPKKTKQKKASRVKAQQANAPAKKASKKTNDSRKSAPSKVSKPKQTQQMQRKSKQPTSQPETPAAVQAMRRAEAELLEESEEMEESSGDQPRESEELSEDWELADELEQTNEDVSGETETRAPSKYAHTTRVQLDGMIRWMEKPSNRAIHLGEPTAGKGMAHGAGVTKLSGFASMAEYVHNYAMKNGPADPRHTSKWDKKTCQSRWNSQFKRYKATRERVMKQTGFGITEEMVMRGVRVEDLIEKACPFYERMDAMFWEQANVEPVAQMYEPVLSEDEETSVVGTADGLNCQQSGENARDPDDHDFRFPDYRDRLEGGNASDSDETIFSFSGVNANDRAAATGNENQCPSSVRNGCSDGLPESLSSPKGGSERNAPATRLPLSELLNARLPLSELLNASNRPRFSWAPTANRQLLPTTTSSPRHHSREHEAPDSNVSSSRDTRDARPLSRSTTTRAASARATTATANVAATSASKKAAAAMKAAAAKAAAAKGAEKAQALKQKYFGSVFAVESEKTRRSAEKRAKLTIASQEKQFEATMAFKQKELEEQAEARRQAKLEREEQRQQKRQEKRDEEPRKMAVELIIAGKSREEVAELVDHYLPSYEATQS